jgi:hypothetical protein
MSTSPEKRLKGARGKQQPASPAVTITAVAYDGEQPFQDLRYSLAK